MGLGFRGGCRVQELLEQYGRRARGGKHAIFFFLFLWRAHLGCLSSIAV